MNRLLIGLVGAALFTGCGGSEAATPAPGPSDDASSDAASTTGTGGTNQVTSDTSTPTEAGFDLDGFSIPDGPLAACATCIRDMCQQDLAACASNPQCQMGVICALQKCSQYAMGEAGLDGLVCITNCFGDIQTAISAANGLSCVTTMCDSCTSILDGGGSVPVTDSAPASDAGSAPVDGGGD